MLRWLQLLYLFLLLTFIILMHVFFTTPCTAGSLCEWIVLIIIILDIIVVVIAIIKCYVQRLFFLSYSVLLMLWCSALDFIKLRIIYTLVQSWIRLFLHFSIYTLILTLVFLQFIHAFIWLFSMSQFLQRLNMAASLWWGAIKRVFHVKNFCSLLIKAKLLYVLILFISLILSCKRYMSSKDIWLSSGLITLIQKLLLNWDVIKRWKLNLRVDFFVGLFGFRTWS